MPSETDSTPQKPRFPTTSPHSHATRREHSRSYMIDSIGPYVPTVAARCDIRLRQVPTSLPKTPTFSRMSNRIGSARFGMNDLEQWQRRMHLFPLGGWVGKAATILPTTSSTVNVIS
jgi:hypothetical protein